jgi:Asp-tRNA(Asn)/Glu-tRNA(Gln) amidotransferase A subunit family amidase
MWLALLLVVCPLLRSQEGPSTANVRDAGRVIGLEFTDSELELMLADVSENLRGYAALRAPSLDNAVLPSLAFTPFLPGIERRAVELAPAPLELVRVERPADLGALAFADIPTLAALVRAREVSCMELAELFLGRLERLDPTLVCVVTLTRERALAQAQALDLELAQGRWRGPLHGIPWGAKDLLATRGVRTTWGAEPFADQVLDLDATVVKKLDAAGAVLIAKLSLGALAWGDVWHGGTTKNPWNPEQGSSGSSAGPASATAAGGVVFAIGSETLGSIVSPSTRCGTSSLRPTFGRVSRHGAMALSWSMDKLGPLGRSARDCALVFDAIRGSDGLDPTARDAPFAWAGPVDVRGWKVGIPKGAFEDAAAPVLAELRALEVELVEVELPSYPVDEMMIVLNAEAATAFDELTRDGRDDQLARQVRRAWPNAFRVARLIPAVEYLRAQRLRTQLMLDMDKALSGVVALVHPSFAAKLLAITNLTGHPTFVAPNGLREERGKKTPTSISFTGHLDDEARLLALAHAWQAATPYDELVPPLEFLAAQEPGKDGR